MPWATHGIRGGSSQALALHGVVDDAGDVDVLVSRRDAQSLLKSLRLQPLRQSATPLFRSDVFARWREGPLDVEIMAGFHVATDKGWHEVQPRTRMPIPVGDLIAWVPDRQELAAMLRLFGRPKDVAHAALLD